MAALADYTNVYDTALAILARKGYQLWYVESTKTYWAERNGWDFTSDSPVGLLGVVAILDFHAPGGWSEYWWRMPPSGLYRNLPDHPSKPYVPVFSQKARLD